MAALLTTFELNPSTITQRWIENKFYSLDEERISNFRNRIRESARFSNTQVKNNNNEKLIHNDNNTTMRCKYCHRVGHTDLNCRDKKLKRPPSMPDWVVRAKCRKCMKSGHLTFNCPPKYKCKVRRFDSKGKTDTSVSMERAAKATDEFAGNTYHIQKCDVRDGYKHTSRNHYPKKNNQSYADDQWNLSKSFLHHKIRNLRLSRQKHNYNTKKQFYKFLMHPSIPLLKLLSNELRRLNQFDLITILWLICKLRNENAKSSYSSRKLNRFPRRKHRRDLMKKNFHNDVTPHHSNSKRKRCKTDMESTFAYKVEHELQARNILPASDLVRGWIIDSGASAHMTPFKQDCNNIQPTYKQIFLADGSSVLCKEMGQVNIPIKHGRRDFGTLVLEDVLIVPNLDRRLFSVNSFLARGNNWIHFENHHIELGIQDGSKIKIPLSSLQTNAMIVNTRRNKYSDESISTPTADQTKDMVKINMNKIHERFHRSEGAIATIRAHNL